MLQVSWRAWSGCCPRKNHPKSLAGRAEILEFTKKAPALPESPPDDSHAMKKSDANSRMADQKSMMENMRDQMGPYTPRELYPSLMHLPDLSPEKRAEIEQLLFNA